MKLSGSIVKEKKNPRFGWEKHRKLSWKFPCEWFDDASFGAVILFFRSEQAYPYSQAPLAMIDTGFRGTRVCRPTPRRALLGWLGREVSEQWRLVRRVLQRCHPSHYFGINGG